ncbi:FKBP-type peptidyl-prolyl cis-trans isomerase [Mucilaginibacter sp. AW1-3]
MKKHLTVLLFIAIGLSSCSKKSDSFDAAAQAAADDITIKNYLTAHPSINATKDPSGLYYQIITQGNGSNASANSTITANYVGTYLDGTVFDQTKTNALSFRLAGVIQGWQIGIPLVKAGGRILLIIPSGLAYGNSDDTGIPPNSVLIFTIDVLTVN